VLPIVAVYACGALEAPAGIDGGAWDEATELDRATVDKLGSSVGPRDAVPPPPDENRTL
jgi:hypothetical protein